LKLFDIALHLGLEKIAWLGLARKQKLLFIVQHMLKNISQNIESLLADTRPIFSNDSPHIFIEKTNLITF
jgi:hypothetical protein